MFKIITVLIAGCLLTLAFAPFSYASAALFSIALLYFCLAETSPKQAFAWGWLFGVGQFTLGVSWVFVSIHTYGNTNTVLASLLTGLFISVLALYQGFFASTYRLLFARSSYSRQIIGFAALWSIFEWLRATLFTGFPWLLIGYSQVNTPLKYLAPIIGVYGLTFIVVLAGCLLYWSITLLARKQRQAYFIIPILILIYTLPAFLKSTLWTSPNSDIEKVSIIQGAIPLSDKWSDDNLVDILVHYKTMTERHWQSKLIVWPEAAIPLSYQQARMYIQAIATEAKQHQATIITGIPFLNENSNNDEYLNGIVVLGQGKGQYFKHHLVPFGEYLPLEKWLRGVINFFDIPMSNMIPGPFHQPLLIANHTKIAPFICYEIAYSDMLLHNLPEAQLLVTISDDAWFGKSFAAAQHLEIAQMRSLQTGRYQIVANNSGISAIISPTGTILKTVPQFTPKVLTGTYQAMQGATPWVVIGDLPIVLTLFFLVIFMAFVPFCLPKFIKGLGKSHTMA